MILGSTIMYRTHGSDELLSGRVGSTWGTAQEQGPPRASYTETETVNVTTQENGRIIVRPDKVQREFALPLDSSRVNVNLHLDHRQKGLLWYSTYVVDFN